MSPRPLLKPPQFRLRTLMLAFAALGVLFALANSLSPYAIFGLILLLLAIVAHVAGNSIGTQLRKIGDFPSEEEARASRKPEKIVFAPASRLSQKTSLGWTVLVVVFFSAMIGAVFGGLLFWHVLGARATWANLSLGIFAFTVIGAFLGFLSGSFLQVILTAQREAAREPNG